MSCQFNYNMNTIDSLHDQNPWWKKREAIVQDKHLTKLEKSRIKWQPRIKYKFDLDKDIVYTLRGPRQIGKTTLLKIIINELLNKVDPRLVLYYTCDLINNPQELVDVLEYYLESIKPKEKGRAFIFLDEISSVKEWQKVIKYLSDTNKLKDITIILTGSHTLDIKKAYERLPGRRGDLGFNNTPDKILLPMKFAEYVETIDKELEDLISKLDMRKHEIRKELLEKIMDGNIPDKINELLFYRKDIERLFENYLITGGVPLAVDEYIRTDKISEGVYRTYIDSVLGDLTLWNKKETYLRQILRRIFDCIGNPVSWNSLINNTEISSHNTAAEYVDALKGIFVLYYIRFYDINKKMPLYQKNKKIYPLDPFFYHALNAWISGRDPFEESIRSLNDPGRKGILIESIVGSHLIRLAFLLSKQKQLFDYEQALFYWKKDREIDFIMKVSDDLVLPIEVKYQPKIARSDRYSIIDFKKSSNKDIIGIILSKDTIEAKNNIITLPVWLFLMLV